MGVSKLLISLLFIGTRVRYVNNKAGWNFKTMQKKFNFAVTKQVKMLKENWKDSL